MSAGQGQRRRPPAGGAARSSRATPQTVHGTLIRGQCPVHSPVDRRPRSPASAIGLRRPDAPPPDLPPCSPPVLRCLLCWSARWLAPPRAPRAFPIYGGFHSVLAFGEGESTSAAGPGRVRGQRHRPRRRSQPAAASTRASSRRGRASPAADLNRYLQGLLVPSRARLGPAHASRRPAPRRAGGTFAAGLSGRSSRSAAPDPEQPPGQPEHDRRQLARRGPRAHARA